MKKIPKQLQDKGFVKLRPKSKKPFELDWPNRIYSYEEISQWFPDKGNYGVHGGHGDLIIIDADAKAVVDAVEEYLPETFTIESSPGKRHFYYICPDIKSKITFDDSIKPSQFLDGETHYGEIISFGSQAVGPGSTHPRTGKPYTVVNDLPIASITKKDVFQALIEFIPLR